MADNYLTTIQTDAETRDKLKRVAEFHERSMAAHLRWLVQREYDGLPESAKEEKLHPDNQSELIIHDPTD